MPKMMAVIRSAAMRVELDFGMDLLGVDGGNDKVIANSKAGCKVYI